MPISRREFVTSAAAVCGGTAVLGGGALSPSWSQSPALPQPAEKPAPQVPWLAEIQRPPAELPADRVKLSPLLIDEQGQPIRTVAAWEHRRAKLRKTWEQFLHPLQCKQPSNRLTVLEEDNPHGCRRLKVRYDCEPGLAVEGYLIYPPPAPRAAGAEAAKLPGVVVLHSTVDYTIRQPAGLQGPPEKHFGLNLARRGFVTFSPKCFLWEGEGNYASRVAAFQQRHPASLGMAKMLWDAQRAVDILASLPEVDAQRIGAVGHSLGAKESLYLAAFDDRIQVTVSSEGGIGKGFSNWHASWYLGPAIQDGTFTRDHHELLAMIAPRPFLLLGGNSADGDRGWPYIEAALPAYELYGKPARFGQFNHRQGHAVPEVAQRRIEAWFETYL